MSILERRNYYGLKAISGLMKESCHTIIHYFYNELLNYNMSYITICPTLQYILHYNMSSHPSSTVSSTSTILS
jgi:hypothetical protein